MGSTPVPPDNSRKENMASVITASELRAVLNGVSSSLYSDAYLEKIIDVAESVVGSLLVMHNAPIVEHGRTSNVALIKCGKPHKFYVGQSVTITNVSGTFNGTKTINAIPDDYSFKFTNSGADLVSHAVIPNGLVSVNDISYYNNIAPVESAVLIICQDIFKAQTSAGATQQGLDFTVQPYILGRSIRNRIVGVLSSYVDVEALIG